MTTTDNLVRPLQVKMPIIVKSYDIDFAGIVSNIVYIRWLEDLRLKILDEHFPFDKQVEQGNIPVLAKTQIEYKRPIKLFDNLIAIGWISQMGRVKMTIQAEFISNNQIAAIATQSGSFMSAENNRPVRIPQELIRIYSQY